MTHLSNLAINRRASPKFMMYWKHWLSTILVLVLPSGFIGCVIHVSLLISVAIVNTRGNILNPNSCITLNVHFSELQEETNIHMYINILNHVMRDFRFVIRGLCNAGSLGNHGFSLNHSLVPSALGRVTYEKANLQSLITSANNVMKRVHLPLRLIITSFLLREAWPKNIDNNSSTHRKWIVTIITVTKLEALLF